VLEADLHAVERLDQDPLHVGPADADDRRTHVPGDLAGRPLGQHLPLPGVVHEPRELGAPLLDRLVEPELADGGDRVRVHREPGPHLLECVHLLEHHDLAAGLAQRHGGGQPADARSYDHHPSLVCHGRAAYLTAGFPS
jgi:hypothetical protein